MGVLGHFAPGIFLGSGVLEHFRFKNQTRKIDRSSKDFELYQIVMYNFLWQTVLMFPIYILLTKRIEIFWFRDISNTQDIRTYCFKYLGIYILRQVSQNQKRKKFELFTKIFEPYQVARYSQRFKCQKYSKIVYIKSITQ